MAWTPFLRTHLSQIHCRSDRQEEPQKKTRGTSIGIFIGMPSACSQSWQASSTGMSTGSCFDLRRGPSGRYALSSAFTQGYVSRSVQPAVRVGCYLSIRLLWISDYRLQLPERRELLRGPLICRFSKTCPNQIRLNLRQAISGPLSDAQGLQIDGGSRLRHALLIPPR